MNLTPQIRFMLDRFLGYIVIVAAWIAITVSLRKTVLVVILLFLIAMPIFSIITAYKAVIGANVCLVPASYEVVNNSSAAALLSVYSKTLLPVLRAEVLCSISHPYYFDKIYKAFEIPFYKAEDLGISLKVPSKNCGYVNVAVEKLRVHDYINIINFTLNFSEDDNVSHKIEIAVMPKVTERFDANLYAKEGFDEYDEDKSIHGNPTPNIADIREYRGGDRLSRIHWKLSARIHKLMFKENENASGNRVCLITELYMKNFEKRSRKYKVGFLYETEESLNKSIINGYAVGLGLVESGESFYFCYYHAVLGDFISVWVTSKEELDIAVKDMYRAPAYDKQNLGGDTYIKAGMSLGALIRATDEGIII